MNPRPGNYIMLLFAGLFYLACSLFPGLGSVNYEQTEKKGPVQEVRYSSGNNQTFAFASMPHPVTASLDHPLAYSLSFETPWWISRWPIIFYTLGLICLLYLVYQLQLDRKLAAQESRHQQEVRRYKRLLKEHFARKFHPSLSMMSFPVDGVGGHLEEEDDQTIQKESSFLEKVNYLVEENLGDENFGIRQLCQKLGISRSQLHRKLKALTGKSTSIVIRSIRLEKAKELLRSSDLNVSEVGYAVGFINRSHFTQVFTDEFGEAPSFFRGER